MSSYNIPKVLQRLDFLEKKGYWPNGPRYLWTDAYGVITYLNLYTELGSVEWLHRAEALVEEVHRVLGRNPGLRIGEHHEGQYFHFIMKWLFALHRISKFKPEYHSKAVHIMKEIFPKFYRRNLGICWKMTDNLEHVYPGTGLGGLDFYQGYVMCKLLDPVVLSEKIGDLYALIDRNFRYFGTTQDMACGDMLWWAHFFPEEEWAKVVKERCVSMLDQMWRPEGYFVRDGVFEQATIIPFGNYGVSIGIQSQKLWPYRVEKLHRYFEIHQSELKGRGEGEAMTDIMACCSYYPGWLLKDFEGK